MIKIVFFETRDGKRPIEKTLLTFSKGDRAKILACLKSVAELGFHCPRVQFRQIKGKLWEIKIGRGRFFYVMIEVDIMIILHVYKKQSQKAPKREIAIAEKRMLEVLSYAKV